MQQPKLVDQPILGGQAAITVLVEENKWKKGKVGLRDSENSK